MYRNFTEDCLEITVERNTMRDGSPSFLILRIASDYAGSCRKSTLNVDGDRLAKQVEEVWKSIKTKKVTYLGAWFTKIDYYSDETDMYSTPSVSIKRGLKKAKIGEDTHGSIPKDWCYNVVARFNETTTVGPIIEVINKVLYSKFTIERQKEFIKSLRPVLQKKTDEAKYYNQQ